MAENMSAKRVVRSRRCFFWVTASGDALDLFPAWELSLVTERFTPQFYNSSIDTILHFRYSRSDQLCEPC